MKEGMTRNIDQTAAWTARRIAERMEQAPIPLPLRNGVEGYGFKVVDPDERDDARTIGIFPSQHVVTITTPDVSIKIRNATATAAKDGVQIDTENSNLRALFLKDGHVAVEVFPSLMPEPVEPPLMDTNRPDEELSASSASPLPGSSGGMEMASEQPTEMP